MSKNKFCEKKVLRNESDVEHFFVDRLLKDLGYKDNNILTKTLIPKHLIGKGSKKTEHRPDYALTINKLWVSVIEAKHPEKKIDSFISEAQDYATIHNRGYIGKDPIKYVLVTNGISTNLLLLNQNKPILDLAFEDFENGNKKYDELKKLFSYSSLKFDKETQEGLFEFRKPQIDELMGMFQVCHNIIRNKHKVPPKKAFYEFTKLLFIKLNEDKSIHKKFDEDDVVKKEDFFFSTHYINRQEDRFDSPINELFIKYRNSLNNEVKKKTKKRIFDEEEKLELSPSTIKEIVKLLENLDLKSVEDDLNGKVFETFLEATVRGKELGQFFTPRTVVKFMVKIANLQFKFDRQKEEYVPPLVLDGCCGSGGFLIFVLSDLLMKAKKLPTDVKELNTKIKNKYLYGVDASEDKIVQIARMNMYIHGDGGSHIYLADTLDKELIVEKGLDEELADEKKELKKLFDNKKFDIVLTNPPFSLKYKKTDTEHERILKQYEIAYPDGKENSDKIRSLNSNVMFIERYYDLLEDGGKLLTVIDESVLNADGQGDEYRKIRRWLRERFIIRAIISLPKNTFVNADAGVKTSILYLIKKKKKDDYQSKVFMAMSKNIGHNDAGRSTPNLNDLPNILTKFQNFENGKNE